MARSQIVNGKAALAVDCLECTHVPRRQIANVNVVSHARSIGSIVVVTKNAEFLADTHSRLRDVRHQVVRNAIRVFANTSTRMRPNRVEVTEQHHIPFRVRLLHVHQYLFEHRLRLSIRIRDGTLRALFGNGNFCRVAIDRRRRREDDILHAIFAHHV